MEGMNPDVVTQFEHDTWSRCADSYLESFAALTSQTEPLLSEATGIESGTRVLEIGTGPGNIAGRLARRGADVDAIDFSEAMLRVARSRFPDLRFAQANAEELPFGDAAFDAVVSNFVVHHLARPTPVFQETRRVLRPGGRLAFVVWGPLEEQSSLAAFFAAVSAHHDLADLPHGPLFGVTDRDTYEAMIRDAGLRLVELRSHAITWRARSLDSVLAGFWSWGNIPALATEVQRRIEASTREQARSYEKNGEYTFPHSVILAQAVRP